SFQYTIRQLTTLLHEKNGSAPAWRSFPTAQQPSAKFDVYAFLHNTDSWMLTTHMTDPATGKSGESSLVFAFDAGKRMAYLMRVLDRGRDIGELQALNYVAVTFGEAIGAVTVRDAKETVKT